MRSHILALAATVALLPMQALAETNILVVVDGSNSMWGQIDGKAKVETARETLGKLVKDLPAEANVGLMAYGNTKEKDCDDVTVLSEMSPNKSAEITKLINGIQPKGMTPIANALTKSKEAFKGKEGQNNHVVLISDGIESCDGDPCAVAKSLQEAGLNVSAQVIGFGVSKEDGKKLTCIAENTGGKYFDAANTAAFNDAIKEVTEIAKAEPKPEPKATMWLDDQFDGQDLAPHWEVVNPNPDNYIVEDGKVLTVSSKVANFGQETVQNIIRLNKELPKGDWRAEMTLSADFQSGEERIYMGLYDDKENYMLTQLGTAYNINDGRWTLFAYRTKVSKGEVTDSETRVWTSESVGKEGISKGLEGAMPIHLRFEKHGRNYTASIKVDGVEEPKWLELPDLKLLRQKGNLAFGVYQSRQSEGETTLNVDSFTIESLGE